MSVEEQSARTGAGDRAAIREIVENWVIWRDTNDWDRFRTLWHDDGRMVATWTQSHVDEFIRLGKDSQSHGRGGASTHFLGGQAIDLAGNRAISQTKMTISVRGPLEGVLCDIVCTGRFYDFLEYRNGRWGIVVRSVIYEKDRADPIDTNERLALDRELLATFPAGYRHIAYMQTKAGVNVKMDMPGSRGPEYDALVSEGAAWLEGDNH